MSITMTKKVDWRDEPLVRKVEPVEAAQLRFQGWAEASPAEPGPKPGTKPGPKPTTEK